MVSRRGGLRATRQALAQIHTSRRGNPKEETSEGKTPKDKTGGRDSRRRDPGDEALKREKTPRQNSPIIAVADTTGGGSILTSPQAIAAGGRAAQAQTLGRAVTVPKNGFLLGQAVDRNLA